MENRDTTFDIEFSKIQGLEWLPWIGINYENNKYKILIVGESHYKIDGNNKYLGKEYTQQCVEDGLIGKEDWYTSTYKGMNRLLSGFDTPNTSCKKKLWQNLGFCNIIQRPMEDQKKRPNKDDFLKGWEILRKVIDICKPDIIIFIGVTASKYCGCKIKSSFKIGTTNAREPIFIKNTNVIFSRHTCRCFSWTKWSKEYLEKYIPSEIKFLRDSIK